MASSALGLLEPGPFSSHVLLRSWPGSGSQGSICVKAGGRHSSRTELVLPWASWRLGPLPESPGPGRLSAPHLPARSEGATLRLQATQPHRLPVASPGPGVHSLCIRSCQWAGELRVHAFLGARLPAVLWVHTCAPGCQATSKDAWVGPSQPCSSRSRLRQAPCTHYWACTNLLGQWPGSVQGAQGDSGRVGSALLGEGVALQGGLGTAWWGGLQTQQRTYHSHPGSWESLPVLPRLMSWLSGSCFPGTVLLLPGHSS